jgi:malate dehydrogenase (oxaloacetate-decarboxylating)
VSLDVRDDDHAEEVAAAMVHNVPGVELLAMSDDVVDAHLGGKIEIRNRRPVDDARDLALVYTPGVAKVCRMIAEDPVAAYRFTIKSNSVAVVTDGTAVLGLGDIGPLASLPVMEGKAMLLKSFGDVDAYPILVDETDPDRSSTPSPGSRSGSAASTSRTSRPRCFEIEGKLRQRLDIPVFHDDQHGTAVVVLAALINAARVVDRDLADLKVVVQGIGAAGSRSSTCCRPPGSRHRPGRHRRDRRGRRKGTRPDPPPVAKQTNPRGLDRRQGRGARRRRRVHRRVRPGTPCRSSWSSDGRRPASCSHWRTRPRDPPGRRRGHVA